MKTKSTLLKATLLSCLLGAAFAASAQGTKITPSEPNVAAPATAPKGEGSRDRAAVRAEGKTAKAAANEGGEAAKAPATTKVDSSRDRAAVRSEGKTAKATPNEGGEAAKDSNAPAARRAAKDKVATAKPRSETAESRSGQQSDAQQPAAAQSTRSKAEVRAEGRKEKTKAVGGSAAD